MLNEYMLLLKIVLISYRRLFDSIARGWGCLLEQDFIFCGQFNPISF